MLRRILVPVDGSEPSKKAAVYAADLAEATGATLTLLNVFDASAAALMGMTSLSGKEVDDAIARVTRDHLDAGRQAIGDRKIEVGTAGKIGHPPSEIIDYAKAENIDMIVMGSRGISALKGVLLGSVSDAVVHRAPCPVTVVR